MADAQRFLAAPEVARILIVKLTWLVETHRWQLCQALSLRDGHRLLRYGVLALLQLGHRVFTYLDSFPILPHHRLLHLKYIAFRLIPLPPPNPAKLPIRDINIDYCLCSLRLRSLDTVQFEIVEVEPLA